VNKTIYSRQGECLRETILELRREAGLNQRQLAARLKRERNLIGRLELGERRLDVVEFYWICKACGANPEIIARKLMKKLQDIQAANE
jgi:transcriptional regulator with XRE-family HTH domain